MTGFFRCVQLTAVIWLTLTKLADGQDTAQVTFTFQEEQDAETFVGNVALASKLTEKITQTVFSKLDFQINTNNYFSMSARNGSMTSKTRIDREKECPDKDICTLDVDVTVYLTGNDNSVNLFMFIKVSVIIIDINDNSPRFSSNIISLSTPEGNAVGDQLYFSPAIDPDNGKNSVAQYTFQDQSQTFELSVPKDPAGMSYLALVIKKVLDRETRDFYQVTVTAIDGGSPPRTGSVIINITVTDINDNAPEFLQSSYNESVLENTPPNFSIMKVSATDKDIGSNADITYQLSSRVSDKIRNTFYINQKTGEIFAMSSIDYEADKQFQITVEALDNGPTQLTARASITLNVVDANDNAPVINVNQLLGPDISESQPVGSFIAYISVSDQDSGDNGMVICDMNDDHFTLDKMDLTNTGRFKVTLSQPLDFETKHIHKVTIACRDNGQPSLSSSAVITVNVLDVNDVRPLFTETKYTGYVMENQRVDKPILTVTAHDFDSGENGRVTYSIEDTYTDTFSMDQNSGDLRLLQPLDRESIPRYEFHVIARDNGTNRLSSSAIIEIIVDDEDDSPPKFPNPVYFGYVLENQPVGTNAGNVTAIDLDTPDNSMMSYSILPIGDDYLSFSINPTNGIIKTKQVFDREVQVQYHVVVRVMDVKRPDFYNTCNFTVIILDDNDNSPVIQIPSEENTSFVVPYTTSVGTLITTIVAKDRDDPTSSFSQLQYYIESGDHDHLFNLNSFTGALTIARIIRAQDIRNYLLMIKAQDNGDPPRVDTRQFNISINGTFPPSTDEAGLSTNILIAVIIVTVTVVLIIAIAAAICLVKKIDRDRQKKQAAHTNTEDRMYQVKEHDVFRNLPVGGAGDEDSNSNNLSKRQKKKEVSFSREEETDSHNTSTGSTHPLTSFKGGTDRGQTADLKTCPYVVVTLPVVLTKDRDIASYHNMDWRRQRHCKLSQYGLEKTETLQVITIWTGEDRDIASYHKWTGEDRDVASYQIWTGEDRDIASYHNMDWRRQRRCKLSQHGLEKTETLQVITIWTGEECRKCNQLLDISDNLRRYYIENIF
ncbi:Protocadherin-11 Y-linked [Bulinus truncatus]|nr:Protocadherin-11 Y-linked [Bulinus truncatus]